MPLQEKQSFIADPPRGKTVQQKNQHLAAKLTVAPHAKRSIFKIRRVDDDRGHGWWVYYWIGSA
jgi:hypothetical protein